MNQDEIIPWYMSDLAPSELRSSTDPVKRARQHEEAKLWAQEQWANNDKCQTCGRPYKVENPKCAAANVHDQVKAEVELETETEIEVMV